MAENPQGENCYHENPAGIFLPETPVAHRDDQYNPVAFDTLLDIENRHFWYLGRYRFLLHALTRELRGILKEKTNLRAVDLGGGCGGWIKYLLERLPHVFQELALADSSTRALELAKTVVGPKPRRYQTDLLNLFWHERWDIAFLLDVLEHIPQDVQVLRQIREALRPGGLLFVTAPALELFRTSHDTLAGHVHRYSRKDFRRLADQSGLELRTCRYFMFFLSPLLLLSRMRRLDPADFNQAQLHEYVQRTHAVPNALLNNVLRGIFSLETPLGLLLPFPWGTSIFGVFRRKFGDSIRNSLF